MAEIGGGENAVNAEPQAIRGQPLAAADDAIGFMQIGEHQIERAVLALVFGYCPIQRGGAARQLGQLAPGARLRSATT